MKKFFLGVFAIAGLVACVQSEEFEAQTSVDNQIAFGGYVGNAVRKAEDPSTKVQDLNNFTVWAYIQNPQATEVGNVFDGVAVTNPGSGWTYDGPRYWMEGYAYRFFAITPYGNGGVTLAGNESLVQPFTNGLGKINFTNNNGTEDVLYASYAKAANEATPDKVTFNFNHILSKVKFSFKNQFDDASATVKVKEVKMVVPAKGVVTLNSANLLETPAADRVKYNWTLDGTETLTLNFGDVEGGAGLPVSDEFYEVDDERLTIPTLPTHEYKITFKVEIIYPAVGNGQELKIEKDFESTLTDYEFVSGTAYNLITTITPDILKAEKIEFDAQIIDWYKPTPEDHELGYYKDVNSNAYVVTSGEGLKNIAAEINAGVATDRDIVLSESIDLNATRAAAASNWTPIGTEAVPFTGTFDGKGFTISNLNIVEDEAKEGKAFIGFFGYAKNATIKNVTFENVTLDIPCLDIDHSQGHIGAVAGSLEGTSTIENVTVKGDIKVYATQSANGASRVAVIAGGNSYGNVTMENVHVIANDGSYLIANNNTGALAGQLQGKSVFKNCSSNINVTVNKFFAGGIIGLAAGDQLFENCHTTGDIAVVAGREGRAHDQYRVGGIAGGWSDGAKNVCTLVNCSYTGKVSGKNSDGSVAEPLDYWGYVGRGYTLNGCQGSKVVIDGTEFVQKYNTAAEAGIYTINGCTPVSTADELVAALEANEGVYLLNDIHINPASMSNAYGKTGINVKNGQTIDGAGHTLNISGAGGDWDSGINTTGGLIKNITVTGSFRGIFINHTSTHSEKVVLEGVTITGTVYTISCDQGLYQGIEATNCTFNGWTSFAKTAGEAKFIGCSFGEGNGYKYCRPYSKTEFVNCTFCPGYTVDKSQAEVTFTDCTFQE